MGRRSLARFASLIAPVALAGIALVPSGCVLAHPHMARVATPEGADVTTVHIPNASGAPLTAWLARGRAGMGAVLLLPGVGENRGDMFARLHFLHSQGYTVLSPDFQASGESAGRYITFGQLESADAHAAATFLRAAAPGERLGVIGISMGGAAALVGARPLNADALVLESVYPTINDAVSDRLGVWLGPLGFLGGVVAPALLSIVGPQVGVSADSLRPIDRIGMVHSPVLMLAGTADTYTPIGESRALFDRAHEPKQFWAVEGAGHEDLYAYAPLEYERVVGEFLSAHLRGPAASAMSAVASAPAAVPGGLTAQR